MGNEYDLFCCRYSILLNYSFQRAHCAICTDRIWGLGRQGYKCINCKLLVHKKCHKLVTIECGRHSLPPVRHTCLFVLNRGFLILLLEQRAKIGWWSRITAALLQDVGRNMLQSCQRIVNFCIITNLFVRYS